MRTITLRRTGRILNSLEKVPEGCILSRAGEVLEPQIVRSTNGLRLINAQGDVNDNNLGFQYAIDTMTYIKKLTTQQKFYELNLYDFIPVATGEGAWSEYIVNNLAFLNGPDFFAGNMGLGTDNSRLATATASISPVQRPVIDWGMQIGYNLIEIQKALRANSWDAVEAKLTARKKIYDIGLQEAGMLGVPNQAAALGLLTQTAVTINTTVIPGALSGMTPDQFTTFIQELVAAYWANTNETALPNRFVMPMSDWLGLGVPYNDNFPNISRREWLVNELAKTCPGMQIGASFYNEATALKTRGVNKQRYALYRWDPESILMDVPVPFTVTQPNSLNNFNFQDAAYCQYTGLGLFRNLELMYFDYTPSS